MNIFILIILVGSIMDKIFAINNNNFLNLKNYGFQIRNTGLRMLVFKEKKYPIILNQIKDLIYYYQIISYNYLYEQLYFYNSLSEDDKLLLETIGSLLY